MNKPYKLYKLDAIEYLKTLPENSVDLIVTNPTYESFEKWRKPDAEKPKHWKGAAADAFHVFPNNRMEMLLQEFQRVMKKNSHLYMICDETSRDVIRPLVDKVGLRFWKSLVWHKKAIGMGYHYRATYQFVLFAEKGKRPLNNLGLPDYFSIKRLKGPGYYPMQMPLELAKMLVGNSSKDGEVVLDPFMGSGTVGVAAVKLGRKFIGVDISESAIERSKERLQKEIDRQQAKAIETAAIDEPPAETENPDEQHVTTN